MKSEDDVGYGKPPKDTRFQKGRSGNPKGRPGGTNNLKTDLAEELQEQVLIREGGQEKRISKQRAMLKSQLAQAVKGDTRAANLILKRAERLPEESAVAEAEELSTNDRAIIEDYKARILREAQKMDLE